MTSSLLVTFGLILLICGIGGVLVWVAYSLPVEPRCGTKNEAAAKKPV